LSNQVQNNNTIYYAAVGYQPQLVTTASLSAVNGSGISGNVTIQVTGEKTSVVNVTLTGLTPGKSYSAALLFGSSQYGEAKGYLPINLGSFTPNSSTYSTVFIKRKGFIKFHIAIDTKTGKILAIDVTKENLSDGARAIPLIYRISF